MSSAAAGVWRHDPQRRGVRDHLHPVHEDCDHLQTTGQHRALDPSSLPLLVDVGELLISLKFLRLSGRAAASCWRHLGETAHPEGGANRGVVLTNQQRADGGAGSPLPTDFFSGFLGSGVACVGVRVIVCQLYFYFFSLYHSPHKGAPSATIGSSP